VGSKQEQDTGQTSHTKWWKNFEDIFIRFDRVYERDRHTDGPTDRRTHLMTT